MKFSSFGSIAFVSVIVLLLSACKKDSYNSTPHLTFQSVNTTKLKQGDLLTFTLELTDKEGDISDSLFIKRTSKVCPDFVSTNVIRYAVPTVQQSPYLKATLTMSFIYNQIDNQYVLLNGCSNKVDTSTFAIWIRDQAGHISDTVTTPPIIFLK